MFRMTFKRALLTFCGIAFLVIEPPASAVDEPDSDAAEAEVVAAELAVVEATRQRALWTTARDALQEARAALQKGDFRAAIQAARFAREQAELGIAQSRAPRFPSKG